MRRAHSTPRHPTISRLWQTFSRMSAILRLRRSSGETRRGTGNKSWMAVGSRRTLLQAAEVGVADVAALNLDAEETAGQMQTLCRSERPREVLLHRQPLEVESQQEPHSNNSNNVALLKAQQAVAVRLIVCFKEVAAEAVALSGVVVLAEVVPRVYARQLHNLLVESSTSQLLAQNSNIRNSSCFSPFFFFERKKIWRGNGRLRCCEALWALCCHFTSLRLPDRSFVKTEIYHNNNNKKENNERKPKQNSPQPINTHHMNGKKKRARLSSERKTTHCLLCVRTKSCCSL